MSKPGKLEEGEIYLGNYLLERLSEHASVAMEVPGDFNLTFLDLVEEHEKITMVGNANELNAAYAADGYARVKQANANFDARNSSRSDRGGVKGLGILITTFGVGELSALNGIAGAFAERIPIVHIVGVPSIQVQKTGALLHHTLGDGKFDVFAKACSGVTKTQAILTSAEVATQEIDRVIRVALTEARPTYITLPTNLVFAPVSSKPLKTPLMPKNIEGEQSTGDKKANEEEKEIVEFVTASIEKLWNKATNPIIIVDACAIRFGVTHLVQELIDVTKITYYTTPMCKGGLPEDGFFGGVYVGAITNEDVKAAVESADLTILIGGLLSDFNSGEFTHKAKTLEKIELHSDHTVVQYDQYPSISFHTLLPYLIKTLKPKPNSQAAKLAPDHLGYATSIPYGPADKMIKQAAFWPMWGEFFEKNDIVIAETGTSSFGMIEVKLSEGVTFISQVLWGSIGYTGGATLGALFAAKEASVKRRTILFIGDGSLQLTVQELGTMIRYSLKPIIVILNNDGYEIERQIHGPKATYNDIAKWSWQDLIPFFNGNKIPAKSWKANTRGELEKILKDEKFKKADKFQILEVMLERGDSPRILVEQAKLSAKLNTD